MLHRTTLRPVYDPPGHPASSAPATRLRVPSLDAPSNATPGAQSLAALTRNQYPAASVEHITTVLERLEASFGAYSGTCDPPKGLLASSSPERPVGTTTSPSLPSFRGLPTTPAVRSPAIPFPQRDYAHKAAPAKRTIAAVDKYPAPLVIPNDVNDRLALGCDIVTLSPCSSATISPLYSPLGFHEPLPYDRVGDRSSLGTYAAHHHGITTLLPPKSTGAIPVECDLPRTSIDARQWISGKSIEQIHGSWDSGNRTLSADDCRNHHQDASRWMQTPPFETCGEHDMVAGIGSPGGNSAGPAKVVRFVGNSPCLASDATAFLHSLGFSTTQEPQNTIACAAIPTGARQAPSPVPQAFPGHDPQPWQPRSSDQGCQFPHGLGQGVGYMSSLAKPAVDNMPLVPPPSLVAPWASDYLRQIYPTPNHPGEPLVLEVKGADNQRINSKSIPARISHQQNQQHLGDHRRANFPVNWSPGSIVSPSIVSSPRPMTPASQSDCSVASWPRSPPPTQGAPRTRGSIRNQGRRPTGGSVPFGYLAGLPGQVFQIYDDDNLDSPFDVATGTAVRSMSGGSLGRRTSNASDPSGVPRPKPHVDTYLAQVVMNDFCERSEQKSQLKLRYRRRWRALSVILHRGEREVAWPLADVLKVVVNEDAGHIVVTMKPGFRRAYRVNPRGPGAAFMPIATDITGGGLDRAAAALLLVAHPAVSKRHLRRLAMLLHEKGVEVEIHSIGDLAMGGASGILDTTESQWARAYIGALIRAVSPEIPAVLADPLHQPNPASVQLVEAARKRQWAIQRLVDLDFALRVLSALPEHVSVAFWAKTYDCLLRDCSCFTEVVTAELKKWNRKVEVLHLPEDNKLSLLKQDITHQDGKDIETAEGDGLDFPDAVSSVGMPAYEGDGGCFRSVVTGGSSLDPRSNPSGDADARCRTHLLLTWLSHLRFALVMISRVEPAMLEQVWNELYDADMSPQGLNTTP